MISFVQTSCEIYVCLCGLKREGYVVGTASSVMLDSLTSWPMIVQLHETFLVNES
jgi:hypothetical protein